MMSQRSKRTSTMDSKHSRDSFSRRPRDTTSTQRPVDFSTYSPLECSLDSYQYSSCVPRPRYGDQGSWSSSYHSYHGDDLTFHASPASSYGYPMEPSFPLNALSETSVESDYKAHTPGLMPCPESTSPFFLDATFSDAQDLPGLPSAHMSDLTSCSFFDENTMLSFVHGYPTPPQEAIVKASLALPDTLASLDHQSLPFPALSESSPCELLGPAKLQPYSPPRHGNLQPRAIRPASERETLHLRAIDTTEYDNSRDDQIDRAKARNDPLYDVKPDSDGHYRCPFKKDFKCAHEKTKQKCIYAKYLDSHLRPYKCKFANGSDCAEARFSSNACLFRHEREAHGLHNHGMNPYPCLFQACERARPEAGFPRRWNQRDHMKRVHGYIEEDAQPANDRQFADNNKRRKSGAPGSVSMKRSGSYAKTHAASIAYPQDRSSLAGARQKGQLQYSNQTPMASYSGSMVDVQMLPQYQPLMY